MVSLRQLEMLTLPEYLVVLKKYCSFLCACDNSIIFRIFFRSTYLSEIETKIFTDALIGCLGFASK